MFCFGHIEHLDGLTHRFSFLHHCALDLDGIFSPDGLWHQSKTPNRNRAVAIAEVLGSVFACVCLSWPRMLVPNDVLLLHFRCCVSAQRWLWGSFRTYRFCSCPRCLRCVRYLHDPGVGVTHARKELLRSSLLACVTPRHFGICIRCIRCILPWSRCGDETCQQGTP